MKLLMLMVDGFEDVEAFATLDVLTRGGDDVTPVSLMGRKEVFPKVFPKAVAKYQIEEVDYKKFDGLIIPGGPGSFKIMPSIDLVDEIIKYYANKHKLVAAICAAPHLVGKLGYLFDKNYTVHPGFETKVVGGHYLRECGVVRDGDFITAKSMYYSIEFGLTIHEYFHGTNSRDKLEKSLQGE
ncbi:MAG: DJ-1/PfpI family protein [Bacilli bacterium]|nr:DJ-1/PfpI family protein [Bacilli bacterium]